MLPYPREIAMNIQFPEFTASQRQAFGKYLPAILAIVAAWLLLRGMRKSFWTLFGLFWAVRAMW
jgi:hypothetical protein